MNENFKACPHCGKVIPATDRFCQHCGQPTLFDQVETEPEPPVVQGVAEPEPVPVVYPEPPVQPQMAPSMPPPPLPAEPPRNNAVLYVIIGMLVAAILGVAAFLAYRFLSNSGSTTDGASVVANDSIRQVGKVVAPTAAAQIDSVIRTLPEKAHIVAQFPDDSRRSLFYVTDGVLYRYVAGGRKMIVDLPGGNRKVKMASLMGDDMFILLKTIDPETGAITEYRFNTKSQEFEQLGGSEASSSTNGTPVIAPSHRQRTVEEGAPVRQPEPEVEEDFDDDDDTPRRSPGFKLEPIDE